MDDEREEIHTELNLLCTATASDFSGLAWPTNHVIRWLYVIGNTSQRYAELELKPGRGIAGGVLKLGRPIIVDASKPEAEQERLRYDYSIMTVEKLHTVIAVPVLIQFEIRGVLLVGNRHLRFYEKNDLDRTIQSADKIASFLTGGIK